MSLRYALLGFLTTEPASGYQLAQEFDESMGWFWSASYSQIHPELRRLEEQGLVSSVVSEEDSRGKRIYSITDEGVTDLERWLAEETEYPPVRDPERIRLVFLDLLSPQDIRRHLERHKKHHESLLSVYTEQLREVRQGTFPRLRKRLAARPADTHQLVSGLKVLALQGNVARARMEIAWAEDGLLWLEGCERSSGDGS
ncbi:PadR family transcriptional regulator [Streptomyces sp. NPDC004237]|uniref:PadR family transcriptional regulator n=1 Tax=Streptomyces sp. NPDC004237 TaxID=3154455 RepID=UPI0033BE37B7